MDRKFFRRNNWYYQVKIGLAETIYIIEFLLKLSQVSDIGSFDFNEQLRILESYKDMTIYKLKIKDHYS